MVFAKNHFGSGGLNSFVVRGVNFFIGYQRDVGTELAYDGQTIFAKLGMVGQNECPPCTGLGSSGKGRSSHVSAVKFATHWINRNPHPSTARSTRYSAIRMGAISPTRSGLLVASSLPEHGNIRPSRLGRAERKAPSPLVDCWSKHGIP